MIIARMQQGCLEIFKSWIDSLKIFLPNNLKLFVLASLNAMRFALVPTILWVMLVAIMYVAIITILFHIMPNFHRLAYTDLIPFTSIVIGILGLVLIVRPSVYKKDIFYVLFGFRYFFYVWLALIVFFKIWSFSVGKISISDASLILYPIFIVIFLFFLCDRKPSIINTVLAIKRMILFSFYNLPFIGVFFLFFFLLSMANAFALNNLGWLLHAFVVNFHMISSIIRLIFSIFFFLYILFFGCLLSIFYTKRVHDQFKVYFS